MGTFGPKPTAFGTIGRWEGPGNTPSKNDPIPDRPGAPKGVYGPRHLGLATLEEAQQYARGEINWGSLVLEKDKQYLMNAPESVKNIGGNKGTGTGESDVRTDAPAVTKTTQRSQPQGRPTKRRSLLIKEDSSSLLGE